MTSQIAKRIIQTGKSKDLPLVCRSAVATIRLLNPDYEYLFFDDQDVENFIDSQFPQYRPIFDGFPVRTQRYDFFRYLAVYHYGGFYFDLDIFLATGLDELLQYPSVFPFEELSVNRYLRNEYGLDWEIGNYAFGAAAGSPFLDAVIKNCIRAQQDPAWVKPMMDCFPKLYHDDYYVLNTTGPGLVTRTLAECQERESAIQVLFPQDVCDDKTWHQFGDYGVHLQHATWRKQKGFLRRRILRMWETWIRDRLLPESQILGPARSLQFGKPCA
jgi:hypothetical protein